MNFALIEAEILQWARPEGWGVSPLAVRSMCCYLFYTSVADPPKLILLCLDNYCCDYAVLPLDRFLHGRHHRNLLSMLCFLWQARHAELQPCVGSLWC